MTASITLTAPNLPTLKQRLQEGASYSYVASQRGEPFKILDEGYSDSGDTVWILVVPAGNFSCNRLAVVGRSFEDAYEAAIDELPTVSAADIHEAYIDPETDDVFLDSQSYQACIDMAKEGEYPELCEGYKQQSNWCLTSGTGVVSFDPSSKLIPWTPEAFPDITITLEED